jgi:hypothetical protein
MGVAAKEYGINSLLRVERPGSVVDRSRRNRVVDGELLTADEIAERYNLPRSVVDGWYQAGRLTARYPDDDGHRHFRTNQVEKLLPLTKQATPPARVRTNLHPNDHALIADVWRGRVCRSGGVDIRRGPDNVWRTIGTAIDWLPPGLVELGAKGRYVLTAKGREALRG